MEILHRRPLPSQTRIAIAKLVVLTAKQNAFSSIPLPTNAISESNSHNWSFNTHSPQTRSTWSLQLDYISLKLVRTRKHSLLASRYPKHLYLQCFTRRYERDDHPIGATDLSASLELNFSTLCAIKFKWNHSFKYKVSTHYFSRNLVSNT